MESSTPSPSTSSPAPETDQVDHIQIQPIFQHFVQSGERDHLMNLLNNKLIECGWKAKVANHCQKVIYDTGVSNISVETLIEQVTPTARQLVPNDLKREMLEKIQKCIEQKLKPPTGENNPGDLLEDDEL